MSRSSSIMLSTKERKREERNNNWSTVEIKIKSQLKCSSSLCFKTCFQAEWSRCIMLVVSRGIFHSHMFGKGHLRFLCQPAQTLSLLHFIFVWVHTLNKVSSLLHSTFYYLHIDSRIIVLNYFVGEQSGAPSCLWNVQRLWTLPVPCYLIRYQFTLPIRSRYFIILTA